MGFNKNLPYLLEHFYCCPVCKGNLVQDDPTQIVCQQCEATYPIVANTPIFLKDAQAHDYLQIKSEMEHGPISKHEYAPRSIELIEKYKDGAILDLGSGGKDCRLDNVIQLDIFNFHQVDVVASGDFLPFKDNCFDAIISQAVFEHLQYPEVVASEIQRVLKPGGVVKIDTAFLQPLHAYPHHYFNATQAGLKHWFDAFEISWEGIEPYQRAWVMLDGILDVYLYGMKSEHRKLFEQATMAEIIDAMQAFKEQKLDSEHPLIKALLEIDEETEQALAAGVSILASNPDIPQYNEKTSLLGEDVLLENQLQSEQKLRILKDRQLAELKEKCQQQEQAISELQQQIKVQNKSLERLEYELGFNGIRLVWAIWIDIYLGGKKKLRGIFSKNA